MFVLIYQTTRRYLSEDGFIFIITAMRPLSENSVTVEKFKAHSLMIMMMMVIMMMVMVMIITII